MNTQQARALVTETFPQPFDKGRFHQFAIELLNHMDGRVFPQVKLTHVKKLPLAMADRAKQKQIADLVRRILAAKQREADASKLEREIDEFVYALYGLTPEEIKIVDGARK